MSANNSTPSPISGSRLDEEDFTSGLDLSFDGAEDVLRSCPEPAALGPAWRARHRRHPRGAIYALLRPAVDPA